MQRLRQCPSTQVTVKPPPQSLPELHAATQRASSQTFPEPHCASSLQVVGPASGTPPSPVGVPPSATGPPSAAGLLPGGDEPHADTASASATNAPESRNSEEKAERGARVVLDMGPRLLVL